jgi:hypothetical protein
MNHRRRYSLLHNACSSSGVQAEGHSIMLSPPRGHCGLAKHVMDEVVSVVLAPASGRKPQQFMRPAMSSRTNANGFLVRLHADFMPKRPRSQTPKSIHVTLVGKNLLGLQRLHSRQVGRRHCATSSFLMVHGSKSHRQALAANNPERLAAKSAIMQSSVNKGNLVVHRSLAGSVDE